MARLIRLLPTLVVVLSVKFENLALAGVTEPIKMLFIEPVDADVMPTVPVPVGRIVTLFKKFVWPTEFKLVNRPDAGTIPPIVVLSMVFVDPDKLLVNAPVTPILG